MRKPRLYKSKFLALPTFAEISGSDVIVSDGRGSTVFLSPNEIREFRKWIDRVDDYFQQQKQKVSKR